MASGKSSQAGFTYIGLLIFVAVLAAGSLAVVESGAALSQRAAEAELLAVGLEMRTALQRYADATPLGQPTEPKELAELLRDPRHPGIVRHLRRIYADPLTSKADWEILRTPDGRITGIHSRSRTPTFRRSDFPTGCEAFAEATRHDQWIFALMPPPTRR